MTRVIAAEQHPIILVANKADMVRSRKVKASLGKELATLYSIKYIETSSGQSENTKNIYCVEVQILFYNTIQFRFSFCFVFLLFHLFRIDCINETVLRKLYGNSKCQEVHPYVKFPKETSHFYYFL